MLLRVNDLDVEVRTAMPTDVGLLLTFIRSMGAFEKLQVSATEEALRGALFGDPPAAYSLLAFAGSEPVGYVIYFFSFASMKGSRALWLDDLFIDPAFRGKGIGKGLMAYLADIAVRNRCARLEWIVLDWNAEAIEFYKGLGAEVLPEWRVCRVDEQQLPRIASLLDSR
ncbi:MAG: GNAT family N-acetyltransferase [bacterium]|nr:GNAT family N-acetyltransferase [bacterium]